MSTWAYTPRSLARAAIFSIPIALLLALFLVTPVLAADLVVNNAPGSPGCSDTAPTTQYCTIQAAIDAAAPGDTIKVYPGNYSETATNRWVLGTNGPHQFGLFIDKANLTIMGVDGTGAPINSYAAVAALVTTNATNNFGYSGIFVQADGVTISGLHIGPNSPSQNKTIEVIGDAFALKHSRFDVPPNALTNERGALYFGDWRYDAVNHVSYIKSYTVEDNWFDRAASISLASGAGYSGPISGRVIKNNKFAMESGYAWAGIAFSGDGSTVPWYVYPVGGAQITGNAFTGGVQYIQARGVTNVSDFDWESYWNNNTYERAAIALDGSQPGFNVRSYSYPSGPYFFHNTRRIAPLLQPQIDIAQPGDTVLVKAGTYAENLTINKHLKLIGAGGDAASGTIIKPAAGAAIAVSGAGQSNSDPLLLQNLRVQPTGADGINLGTAQYVRFDNVHVVGPLPATNENENCLKVSTAADVSDLNIVNSEFSYCDYGWYFAKSPTDVGGPNVRNVYVGNTVFDHNSYKGLYVEKLSDATFENVVVTNNGSEAFWNNDWNGGFDINLKGQVAYKNLVFKNLVVTGNGLGFKEGAGLMIKARDDAPAYDTYPASLDNVLIDGGLFTGNERGIRIGEPNKSNAGPTNVQIHNASIYGNVGTYTNLSSPYDAARDPSARGGLVNQSDALIHAENNWWGSAAGPSSSDAVRVNSPGFVSIVPPATIPPYLAGEIITNPFLTSAPSAVLVIPGAQVKLPSTATSFTLPVNLTPGSGPFSSVAFSVDYDQACLSIDPTDANNDGIPEAITGMPIGFVNSIQLNPADTDGELDVAIWDVTMPMSTLPAGALVNIKFTIAPACRPADTNTFVVFSNFPGASFSDLGGQARYGTVQGANPLLLDYNQAPGAVSLSPSTVAENQPVGAPVGTLSATDPDSSPLTFAFATTCSGTYDNSKFAIAGSTLKTAAVFDYEAAGAYAVCVVANDGELNGPASLLAVTVANGNDAPTNIILSATSVQEGLAADTPVGTISTVDQDGGTFTYALATGDGDADNSKFTIVGDVLKTNQSFDYATTPQLYIRVRSTDGSGAWIEKQFVIKVIGHSKLSIADTFVVRHGQSVAVPVVFTANGNTPTGGAFTLGYNASCLAFTSMTGGTGSASGGVLNVTALTGPFVNGSPVVTLNFTALATCASGTSVPLTFGATTLNPSLPVTTQDGKVLVIANSARGDCNLDGFVNAGDFSAIVLETFDNDGTWWLDAPKPTFFGSPVGCDANASTYIDVADVVCTVLVVFGNSSCTTGTLMAAADAPAATLAVEPAVDGAAINVPVTLNAGGQSVSGAAFTLTYDPATAAFDAADANGDGIPDAISFAVPADLQRSVSVDAEKGLVKVAVYGLKLPLPTIADGSLATIRLQATGEGAAAVINVIDLALGSDSGANIPVSLQLGGQAGYNRSLYLPSITK